MDGQFLSNFSDQRYGLTVSPTTFEASAQTPTNPRATTTLEVATMAELANGGTTLSEAERSGHLLIAGDRARAIELLDGLVDLTDKT